MSVFFFYYVAFTFPIVLLWAALQDFVSDAIYAAQPERVRRLGYALVMLGVVHVALALVGASLLRQVRET